MPDTLRTYLAGSALLHAIAAFGFMWTASKPPVASSPVYRIDFIGPASGILNRDLEAAGAAVKAAPNVSPTAKPTRPPPQVRPDEYAPKGPRAPLPRPSVLGPPEREKPPPPAPSQAGPGRGPAWEAAVSPDLPNFPYPWYVSQVRGVLWNQWALRMPAGEGETVIVFSILKTGGAVDLRVESSSGDAAFDFTALGAAQDSAPFPPLPRDFPDPFLKVHVRFVAR